MALLDNLTSTLTTAGITFSTNGLSDLVASRPAISACADVVIGSITAALESKLADSKPIVKILDENFIVHAPQRLNYECETRHIKPPCLVSLDWLGLWQFKGVGVIFVSTSRKGVGFFRVFFNSLAPLALGFEFVDNFLWHVFFVMFGEHHVCFENAVSSGSALGDDALAFTE